MERRDFLVSGGAAALILGSGAFGANAALAAGNAADLRLNALLDAIFNDTLAHSPEYATALGLDSGKFAAQRGRLSHVNAAERHAALARTKAWDAKLQAIAPAGLSAAGKQHRTLALYMLETGLKSAGEFDLDSVQTPYRITQQGGAYFALPDFLNSQHPIENTADCEAYLARLSALAGVLDEDSVEQLAEAKRGLVAPGWSLDLALGQLQKLRAPAAGESGMVSSLAGRAKAKGIAGNWSARAAKIVEAMIYPALDRQIQLLTTLRRTTPAGDGAWRFRRGDEVYAAALAEATTTSMSADEVHAAGLAQVADISAQLDAILKAAGLTQGSVGARLTVLNHREDQLYPATDAGRKALIDGLNAGIADMWTRLPRAFADIPHQPLEIRRVPVDIQDGASNGYYNSATLDGSRPAIYWINLKEVGDWPKYSLPSLTFHEGVPGHHLQGSYAQKAGDLPMLIKNNFISSYGEGWALYAEQLADELGAYNGIERAGYLQSFLFRAARLVVDTGIHHLRWSREQATDYMVETTGFARARSQREVERYCTMIGQACSYKIGHMAWVKNREKAKAALGDKFSLAWYHEILKEGVMPLSVLEARNDARIRERLAG